MTRTDFSTAVCLVLTICSPPSLIRPPNRPCIAELPLNSVSKLWLPGESTRTRVDFWTVMCLVLMICSTRYRNSASERVSALLNSRDFLFASLLTLNGAGCGPEAVRMELLILVCWCVDLEGLIAAKTTSYPYSTGRIETTAKVASCIASVGVRSA